MKLTLEGRVIQIVDSYILADYIEFFKFRGRFEKMNRYKMGTRSLWYLDMLDATGNFMAQSAMMKYIYFEWEKKYETPYPQPECIMKYDVLMKLIEEYKYSDEFEDIKTVMEKAKNA